VKPSIQDRGFVRSISKPVLLVYSPVQVILIARRKKICLDWQIYLTVKDVQRKFIVVKKRVKNAIK
jgi:hypothetical protein